MKQHTKTLGQVFLHDQNIINKIIDLAYPNAQSQIVEIGCGKGSLTTALSTLGNPVHIIEIDERWLEEVKKLNLKNTTFELQDALKADFSRYKNAHIIANLPYQITTPLITHFATFKNHFDSVTIMIQKELAERLLAVHNTKLYGAMTLFTNYHFKVVKGFSVSRNCFNPVPNVDSYVLKLIPKQSHLTKEDERIFFAITRSFFWGRRKTMLKCLLNSPYLDCDSSIRNNTELSEILSQRGESLSLKDQLLLFPKLTTYIKQTHIFK